MPKKVREMSAAEIRNLTRPGRHAVGGVAGLLLVVKDTGAKSWILRTKVGKLRRSIGLGGFPDVPLAMAREKARQLKENIISGVDPVEDRLARARALINVQTKSMVFAEAARMCHAKKIPEFNNEKHAKDWLSSLERYAFPIVGKLPVDEIDLTHILKILKPIWNEKTETATRLRQRIESVLAWATVAGHRSGDNPARWQSHLDAVLPKPSKLRKARHYPALPWQDMGQFMADLRQRQGMGARALEFIILTVVRSGECRMATWDEINLENKTWLIPAARMKMRIEHKVPLSDKAVQLLKDLPRLEDSNYVFFAPRGGPLSDMSISAVCKRMKVKAVPHGFRSTFRNWAAEATNYPREIPEMALAHRVGNSVELAYMRSDLIVKRAKLMQQWADHCDIISDKSATVTPINMSA
jgi:integrase